MGVQWQKLIIRAAIWLCAEITLSCMGLDDLADYSEFLFQDRNGYSASGSPVILVAGG